MDFETYTGLARRILLHGLRHSGHGLPSEMRPRSFFDYGCGGGHFVQAAKNLGFDSLGMELDPVSVQHAQSRGLNVECGSLPRNLGMLNGRRFDVIKAMHVLAHVPTPLDVATALRDLLNPGGLLLVDVPDQRSFPAAVKKMLHRCGFRPQDWGFIQPPIHLHGFMHQTLCALGSTLGLKLLSLRRTSPLDRNVFPTTKSYWRGLKAHQAVYFCGRLIGSGGYLTVVYRKAEHDGNTK